MISLAQSETSPLGELMAGFKLQIIYRPGAAGVKPDTLLRCPEYWPKEGDSLQAVEAMSRRGQVNASGRPSESIEISSVN